MTLEEKQHCRIGMAKIDRNLCVNCGICAFKCPVKALSLDENRILQFDGSKCIGCGACQISCPQKAIEIVGITEQSKTI
jgi:MinD superfamily P-loop ATPase